jgi:hypothetical protein
MSAVQDVLSYAYFTNFSRENVPFVVNHVKLKLDQCSYLGGVGVVQELDPR